VCRSVNTVVKNKKEASWTLGKTGGERGGGRWWDPNEPIKKVGTGENKCACTKRS